MTKIRDKVASLSAAERAKLALRISRRKASADESGPTEIRHDAERRFEAFPLTNLQQAYWVGRSSAFDIGNVASHSYLEVEADFDLDRLQDAWRKMVARHDMLRAVIHPDGQQQVLETVPDYQIVATDLRTCSEAARNEQLEALYNELSHQVLDPAVWPMFDIKAAYLPDNKIRICFSIDALIADGWSLYLIFNEWAKLYSAPDKPLPQTEISFRDYVLAEKAAQSGPLYEADKQYWQDRVKTMSGGPDLPLAASPAALDEIRFERRVAHLDKDRWTRFKEQCNAAGLTFNAALIAAYAKVVASWSQNSEFLLSVPQFNRQPLHPQVNQIIGEAASFLPLQVSVDNSLSFKQLAANTQDRLWHDLDHTRYTGVEVLRDLAREIGSTGGVLVPVVYTAAPQLPDGSDASAGVAARDLGTVTCAINQTSQVWLDNHVSEQDGELVCDWDSVVGLFPEQVSARMLVAYMNCLIELADNPKAWEQPLASLGALVVSEEELAVREAGYHELPVPDKAVFSDILAHAAQRPTALALVAGNRKLNYGELAAESAAWAAHLHDRGVVAGDRVVVCMEKGWEQVIAALAILRAGAAYVPVDPAVPDERLAWLIEKSQAKFSLTQSWLVTQHEWPADDAVIVVDSNVSVSSAAVPGTVDSDAIACVIFTSGSTGLPKGVMLSHHCIMSTIHTTAVAFDIDSNDCILGVTALHHDLSLFDLFGVLGAGGRLVLPEPAGRRDPSQWAALANEYQVTLWNSVPAMMEMYLEYAEQHAGAIPDSLRRVFLGGDWVPVDIPGRLIAQNSSCKLVTIGGPTETTIWNIWYEVDQIDPAWKSIPYGRPIANTRYYILDEDMNECPDWVTGMMYATGPGVAVGYLDDAELTAAKFLNHKDTGERMFRTGDQGRWRGDGTIEFMGRADFQLKIQGQRIEPGEIESALREHATIAQALVVAIGEPRGRKQLAAYVVAAPGASPVNAQLIRDFLATKLPAHMVPPVFVELDEMPLTANGKFDRAALPAPDAGATSSEAVAAIDSETVREITALVADVLKLDIPDPTTNLMSLGANSIDMVRIGNRLETVMGSRPRMDEIFRLQSAQALAGWYEPADGEASEQATTKQPASSTGSELVDRIIAATRVMIEPEERDAFKENRPGVRKDTDGRATIALPREITDAMRDHYRSRRSCRNFSLRPVRQQDLSDFVGCLAELEVDGNKHKFLYASPGGLNPIQLYLHIKPGRVEGVSEGTYYYHPEQHALVRISDVAELDRDMHIPFINTPIFDECAFSLYLVADLNAIVPAYGDRSMHFISLEVGAISQLLDMSAAATNIGICQIGTIEFDRIAQHFDLEETHICIHSMVAGAPAAQPAADADSAGGATAKASELLRRVKELSDDEARELLESEKRAQKKG